MRKNDLRPGKDPKESSKPSHSSTHLHMVGKISCYPQPEWKAFVTHRALAHRKSHLSIGTKVVADKNCS